MMFILIQFLGPLRRVDWILFFAANVIFIFNDYQAIQSGFFFFKSPDLLGLPYWEFVSWGFWIIFAYRILPKHFPTNVDLRAVVLAIVFSQSFALITTKEPLLAVTSAVVLLGLAIFRSAVDVELILLFSGMGLLIETVGLRFDLWGYKENEILVSGAQFVVMWAGVGLLFRNLVGPFLLEQEDRQHVHRTQFISKPEVPVFSDWGRNYSFQTLIEISNQALSQANMRRSIECLREALMSAQTSEERARAHLLLGGRYRMIIQMRNAKREFELAFQEMGMDLPRNYTLQALKSALEFVATVVRPPSVVQDPAVRATIQLKVELYEEIGLSGYYMHENLTMAQA